MHLTPNTPRDFRRLRVRSHRELDEADGMSDEGLRVELPAALVDEIVSRVTDRVLEALAEREAGRSWPEWMSVETAAAYLDVSPEGLRKLVARRQIPFSQEATGCRILFGRRDLDAWLAGQRQPARLRQGGRA
jgi:excisionase family DNA binding protein